MKVALITIGDEVLSGDVVNTNANWLASELTDRGVTVSRILTIPDDHEVIVEYVDRFSNAFDRVIVTGGIGGTPDDITMEAVAAAFDRTMATSELALADVNARIAEIEERAPDLDIDVDVEAEAAIPAGGRPLLNPEGLSPGCILENVYVLPGIPDEMKGMFETVAEEFRGDLQTDLLYTLEPESNIVPALEEVMDEFAVSIGCYPDREAGHNRLKITGTDPEHINAARDWLLESIEASPDPVSRH